MTRIKLVAASVAGALALASAAALAQPYGGPGPRGGMWGGAVNAQERLAARKAALGITAEQEPLWNAYAALVGKQADTMAAHRETMWNSNTASSADRMARQSTFMAQRAQDHQAISQAYTALYATLSPQQRALADQGYGPGAGMGPRGWR